MNSLVSAVKKGSFVLICLFLSVFFKPSQQQQSSALHPFTHYYCFMLFGHLHPFSSFFFSLKISASSWIHFVTCCLVNQLHAACIYANAISPNSICFTQCTQNEMVGLYIFCCYCHQYHLVFYTHEKTFSRQMFCMDIATFKKLITKEQSVKQRTQIMMMGRNCLTD